jgi:hypothetical protein
MKQARNIFFEQSRLHRPKNSEAALAPGTVILSSGLEVSINRTKKHVL